MPDQQLLTRIVRSIPACAGEPPAPPPSGIVSGVYPRVCGGTIDNKPGALALEGLSPRVRGNRWLASDAGGAGGSIPACAGEPDRPMLPGIQTAVYPRVCGGTQAVAWKKIPLAGLSPRVRGNRAWSRSANPPPGSIPACAGEPLTGYTARRCGGVYPRVCGGTINDAAAAVMPAGLSPRVRGNLGPVGTPGVRGGSIPACAGEPRCPPGGCAASRVYPRVCGGTPRREGHMRQVEGLSPRVRGNRGTISARRPRAGSIPACAGEPGSRTQRSRAGRVYPRVCGGTRARRCRSSAPSGLSPRVRGNHHRPRPHRGRVGSIPACAGEPRRGREARGESGVYPRVCGGTRRWPPYLDDTEGLSPRVRGNRDLGGGEFARVGSIPACAGEPRSNDSASAIGWVYPRVCGGTARAFRIR